MYAAMHTYVVVAGMVNAAHTYSHTYRKKIHFMFVFIRYGNGTLRMKRNYVNCDRSVVKKAEKIHTNTNTRTPIHSRV